MQHQVEAGERAGVGLVRCSHARWRNTVETCISSARAPRSSPSQTTLAWRNVRQVRRSTEGAVTPSDLEIRIVGLDGLEPSTSSLSGKRSNRAELQAPIAERSHAA